MANPQLEDGYTSIANEILERLALIKISATDWRVLVTIIRRTYGFHKKVDWIGPGYKQDNCLPVDNLQEDYSCQLRGYFLHS